MSQQVINAAGRLLQNPENRTRGAYARNSEGLRVDVFNDSACRFCLAGAIEKAAGPAADYLTSVSSARSRAASLLFNGSLHLGVLWDESSDEDQEVIVQKMINYTEKATT